MSLDTKDKVSGPSPTVVGSVTPLGKGSADVGVADQSVSRKEFLDLQQKTDGIIHILGDISKKMDSPVKVAEATATKVDEAAPRNELSPVPPSWRELVDKILGPDFQIEFEQPPNGGQKFKIIVPKEKSNADQQYWLNFNRDVRTREIGNTGIRGVQEWCIRVRNNLLASNKQLVQYP